MTHLRNRNDWKAELAPMRWIPPLVTGEEAELAALGDQDRRVGLSMVAMLHARGAHRHPWDGDAGRLRLLREQPLDVGRRHMALDEIAADLGGVAARQFVRNAEPLLDRGHVLGRDD